MHPRTRAEIERFPDGLELVPPCPGAAPGLTDVGPWGAGDIGAADGDGSRVFFCGVASKP